VLSHIGNGAPLDTTTLDSAIETCDRETGIDEPSYDDSRDDTAAWRERFPSPATSLPSIVNGAAPHLNGSNPVDLLTHAIRQLAGDSINEQRVIQLIEAYANKPKVISVAVTRAIDGTTADLGLSHKQLPLLIQMAAARGIDGNRLNIWLTGAPGTGKTKACEQVAEALGLPFGFNGALDSSYKLLGFVDAQGRIVSTVFRKIYEHGGIYLFDEIDGSLQPALLALQAAMANGYADFADGPINRHPDYVILAAANTYGHGATDQFCGRMKQDVAFLDRFVFLDWQIDEDLERALCPDSDWCDYVQKVRRNVSRQGMPRVIVSPRASFQGAALLATGLDRATVAQVALRKGMSAEQWQAVA
jgi:hypothetical protein